MRVSNKMSLDPQKEAFPLGPLSRTAPKKPCYPFGGPAEVTSPTVDQGPVSIELNERHCWSHLKKGTWRKQKTQNKTFPRKRNNNSNKNTLSERQQIMQKKKTFPNLDKKKQPHKRKNEERKTPPGESPTSGEAPR